MAKARSFKVKGYKKLRALAPRVYQVKGKVNVQEEGLPIQLVGWSNWGCRRRNEHQHHNNINNNNNVDINNLANAFSGPSLQQRLFGFALASSLITVTLDTVSFTGRVISVDGNAFEITVVDPLNSHFMRGAIVTVNLAQVNAFGVGGF